MKRCHHQGFVLILMSIVLAFIAAAAFAANRQHGMLAAAIRSELESSQANFLARAAIAHATWKANKANCSGTYPSISGTIPDQGSYSATVTIAGTSPIMLNIAGTGTAIPGAVHRTSRTGVRPHTTTVITTNGNIQADTTISGNPGQTNTNYGPSPTLTLDNNQKILMSFGNNIYGGLLSHLLISELLTINQSRSGSIVPVTLYVYPIKRAWPEPGATWLYSSSTATPPIAWTTIGGDYDPTPIAQVQLPTANGKLFTIDLTPAAEAWKSNNVPFPGSGIALVPAVTNLNNANFFSAEANPSTNRPTLVVKSLAPCA